jgi:hypothetical protein
MILNGDTSGAITVTVPSVAGTNTATLPAATGTVMVSGNMPAFSAYNSANQSITTNTYTKLTFDTKEFDTNSNFATSRFTPTVAGYYQFNASLYPNTTVSSNNCAFYKNGSIFKVTGGVSNSASANCSALIYMNGSTDYVEVYGYLVGTSPAYVGSSSLLFFNGVLVRAA